MVFPLDSWAWRFLEDYVYYLPPPPPRKRPKDNPMQVICVGPPRSGTESLQRALIKLGYDYTYHGWDMMFEDRHNMPGWCRLARRKFLATDENGDCEITAEEFDALLGHAVAVTDAPASVFASEMIRAYPEAKVILNISNDLDRWHRSAIKNIVGINRSWMFWLMSWWSPGLFWAWHMAERYFWPGLFRCMGFPGANLEIGIVRNGKWIYREHCNMIRGLVPKERLLEWNVLDGWEPLCRFLGKDIPQNEPFPHVNDAAGYQSREKQAISLWFGQGFKNMVKVAVVLAAVTLAYWRWGI
ncbi:uncharacterized protein Z518_09183 [Rhinocladiella mackenziei CBS 650.93]|uniref:NAD dependent epimerase/dehydratase n=1 Tax=Rhinocladiella mackenziei CBS 650.93 TaxID=1442369 RepID=A0A0D2FHJ7_9EURO|nr:uncharacterized protein Z518_09183 [Rhinocladiella mackenziei CBS 650.93]KIX01457.1 hypothetical protein Z518_09183 [Rhinocladiella mackenziei CBS 650.93]